MTALKNLTGQRFGRLTVVKLHDMRSPAGKVLWDCTCDCGGVSTVLSSELTGNGTRSCGCLKIGRVTHDMSRTVEYKTWQNIKDRCYNRSNKDWPTYGALGITVCERWLASFEAFYADMGDRPSDSMSIDRIDTNGNYEPTNCRWATPSQQRMNQRRMYV